MKGRIMCGKKGLDSALVSVYLDSSSTLVQKTESDEKGWLALRLPVGKFYIIQISKTGYVPKIITIDSHMPKSFQTGDYYFEFSADLFEEIQGLDVTMLKLPVAKIFFNSFAKKFDYDYNYTAKINNDIKKLYESYKALKRKQDAAATLHKDAATPEPTDSTKGKK